MDQLRLVIAGGGTGGHLFPGIAVARKLQEEDPKAPILFVGTERGIENRILAPMGFDLKLIDIGGLKGKGIGTRFKNTFKLPRSIFQAKKILKKFKANAVIGLGGYAAGPVIIAAWLSGIPVFLMEQNSVPGITNKMGSRFAKQIFTTFEHANSYFSEKKVIHTGNPVRKEFYSIQKKEHSTKHFNLLVFGGSLGAKKINEVMTEVAPKLGKIIITHQVGKRTLDETLKNYGKLPKNITVTPFIDDMATAYATADLVICRAGATSISELQAAKRASILIPFPFATDNHQVINAQELVRSGGSLMIEESELTAETLKEMILDFITHPEKLSKMEQALEQDTQRDSAILILNHIKKYIKNRT